MNTGFVRLAVATVPTVYGIETLKYNLKNVFFFGLQQYLPFTVLKLDTVVSDTTVKLKLQQYLPFTVLKHSLVLR